MSMTGRISEKWESASQLSHFQAPWRSLGIGIGAVGAPAATSCLHPVLGLSIFAAQAITLMIIFGSALFGKKTVSDRAFRLLRWLAARPEPTAPPSDTSSNVHAAQ